MEWGSGALAIACLAAAVLHLVRLVVVRSDVLGEVSHAAMALGMVAMASPFGNPVPAPVWTAVYVLIAMWFAPALLRRTRGGPDPVIRDRAVHHVVGSGAMLFMLAAGHSAGSHAGHGGHGEGVLPGVVPVTAMALTGYFAWHALCCAERCRRSPVLPACHEPAETVAPAGPAPELPAGPRALALHTPQTGAAGHLVAAVAMTAMLMGML